MSSSDSSLKHGARVKRPERMQVEWQTAALDDLVGADHRVRLVWAYVDSLNVLPWYEKIRAVEGQVGRDAVDPKILMALWMFATLEGVSSARHLGRLCERDLAYRWLCGGVGVNYHLLSDFRTGHGEFLDQLLTDTVGTLIHQGLVTLETVAQDGMRVRAHAGSSSFRRGQTLEKCRAQAREQVRRLREESERETDPDSSDLRRQAAQARAAREREQRVGQALEELKELRKTKEKKAKGSGQKARTSTTDPQARRMKMPDGGTRPGYNVQFATDGEARVIVSVDITNSGTDQQQMPPLHAAGTDPHARQRDDTDEVATFRQRMATAAAKALYKQRSSIAEYPNAEYRNRGLHQFRVRGREKVKAVTLWYALNFNFMRLLNLGGLRT